MPTLQLSQPSATFVGLTSNIDDRRGVIRGVSVITEGEAQGHGVFIDSKTINTTLAAAKQFPGGVPCKMDHGSGLPDIVGTFHNFRVDGAKLRADLQLLLTHPRYQSLMELAKRAPTASGMSISFKYVPETIKDQEFVRVTKLFSIDWVDGPAANPTGLFSRPKLSPLNRVEQAIHAELTRNNLLFQRK